jgi:hypothetical protein
LEILPLANAVFNCSKLRCQNALCNGVDEGDLRYQTWRASCYAEAYFHTSFLSAFMVVVVFILLQVSRIFTLRGLVRVYWRYLHDGTFSFLGSTLMDGTLRYPSIITEDAYSMRRAIQESLKLRIYYWERKAWSILVFGLAANLPWIVSLSILNAQLRANGEW